jgi:hypothetical protein
MGFASGIRMISAALAAEAVRQRVLAARRAWIDFMGTP